MNRSIVEKRYTTCVVGNLDNVLATKNGVITQNINVPFAADAVIVRKLNYSGDRGSATEGQIMYMVKWENINTIIGAFTRSITKNSPNVTFDLRNQTINGLQTFTILNCNTNLKITTLTCTVTIMLEFVKYGIPDKSDRLITNSYVHSVGQQLNTTGQYRIPINVPFMVDDIVVRYCTTASAVTTNSMYVLNWQEVGDLISFTGQQCAPSAYEVHISDNRRTIQGNQTFSVRLATGTTVVTTLVTSMFFQLEFLQYNKPGKDTFIVSVAADLTGKSLIQQSISLPFPCSQVTCRSIMYFGASAAAESITTYMLGWDALPRNTFLGAFSNVTACNAYDNSFDLNKQVHGLQTFTIYPVSTPTIPAVLTNTIFFILEFRI